MPPRLPRPGAEVHQNKFNQKEPRITGRTGTVFRPRPVPDRPLNVVDHWDCWAHGAIIGKKISDQYFYNTVGLGSFLGP